MNKKIKYKGSSSLAYKFRCMYFVNKLNLAESIFLKDCVIKHIEQLNKKVNNDSRS